MSVFQSLMTESKVDTKAIVESVASKGAKLMQENGWEGRYPHLTAMAESTDLRSNYIAGVTAQVMENLNKTLEKAKASMGEATISANLGSMAMLTPRVVDIVGIFYPNMISHLITDIQAIDRSTGEVFVIKPKYSNTAAGVTAGEEVFTNITDGNYASEETSAALGTADGSTQTFSTTINGAKVRPGTFTVLQGGEVVAKDADGVITGTDVKGAAISGTIDYGTGAVSVTFATAPKASDGALTYDAWLDSEKDPSMIREVEFEIAAVPVTARAHPLKYKVSVQSQLIAQAHLDIDVNDVLTQEAAGLIKQERDIRMVDKITNAASHNAVLDFSASMTGVYYSKKEKYSEIELKINQAGSLINKKAGRGGVSFVIAGINAANVMTNISGFESAAEAAAPIGPYKLGAIRNGTVPVICVPNSNTLGDNDYVVGFRGYQAGDSATVLAEWIPLYFTALWESPDLINSKGLLSMYDLFVNNKNYLMRGSVSDYAA